MRRPLIALPLLACLIAPPALAAAPAAAGGGAPPSYERAEQEAARYLIPCRIHDHSEQRLCKENQYNFVMEYVIALSGDVSAMGSTAYSFAVFNRDSSYFGMPANQVLSCAWYRLIVLSEPPARVAVGDGAMVGEACGHLTPSELATADADAGRLVQRIGTEPVHLPTPDWMPDWRVVKLMIKSRP